MLNVPQPKGGMCANCNDAVKDCSHLPFYKMPVIEKDEEVEIVKCTSFKRPDNTGESK